MNSISNFSGRNHYLQTPHVRTAREIQSRGNYRSYSNHTANGSVTLREPYFSQIENKIKTIEGRINSGQFKSLREGDTITFCNQGKLLPCLVKGKRIYRSFEEMLEKEGVKKCLPDARSLKEGVAIYDNLPGFKQRAIQHGVVAIEITPHTKEIQTEKKNTPNVDQKEKTPYISPLKRNRDYFEEVEPDNKKRRVDHYSPKKESNQDYERNYRNDYRSERRY